MINFFITLAAFSIQKDEIISVDKSKNSLKYKYVVIACLVEFVYEENDTIIIEIT